MQYANSPVYGVILAGGEGQRLWPVSRKRLPKYCIRIGSDKNTLLGQAYNRLRSFIANDRLFVVAQKPQAAVINKLLPKLPKRNLIAEPFGKNTASAIGLAAVVIGKIAPDAVMVVVPADHFIPESEKKLFCNLAKTAVKAACRNNSLVTVGVKPAYPATGFGYIKPVSGSKPVVCGKPYRVHSFVEKPNLTKAKRFLKNGYLWNAGIFVWEVTAILEAIRDHLPKLCRALARIDKDISAASYDSVLLKVYKKLDNISIDYGVLEKTKNVLVIPTNLKWDDVGSWLSFTRISSKDKNNNVINANFKGIDTANCVIISKDKGHLIATYGLKDMVIVNTGDATLVCSKDKAEKIKELVNVSEHCFR